jgi:hypothetical protein
VTFRTPENYCTESIVFDVTEVNLPFNAILDQAALTSSWPFPLWVPGLEDVIAQ